MKQNESVLDAPKPTLDPAVWDIKDDGQVELTLDASLKILKAIDYILSKFNFPNLKVYIIGSITSNSYSEDSDVDINLFDPSFAEMSEEDRLALATLVKQDFQQNYMDVYPAEAMIGTHPFEIYIQNNVFKCFASVGCYDFFERKWEVGPDFKDEDFDPISHYYNKSMKFAKKFVEQLRTLILETYENALIAQKTNDEGFKEKQKNALVKKLKDAKELYGDIKKTRAKYDDDLSSKEDAEKRRKNENWHTVDAAYKLMDKFGYIHILKELAETYNRIDDGEDILNLEDVIADIIKTSFSAKTNLNDSELMLDEVEKKVNSPGKVRIWIDDIRTSPSGYVWIKSVDEFIEYVERNGWKDIEVIDTDHDAGDFQKDGGDYIRCFDYLDFIKAKDMNVRIHSANPVGVQNIRRIIEKNGWNEIFNVYENSIDEGIEWFSPKGNFLKNGSKFDCKFPPLDKDTAKRLTGLDMVEFFGEDNKVKSCIGCNGGGRAYAVIEKNGIYIPFYVSSGDGEKDQVPTGHWYPFFGKGEDGWLNKGSLKDILNYYGSKQLRLIAQTLDSKLNMNTLVKFDSKLGSHLKGFPYCMASSNDLKKTYNRDVNPVSLGDRNYKKNINDFLMAIGDFPLYESVEQIDEGLASNIAIAALLAIPGILPKDSLALELNKVPKNLMYMTSKPVQKAIDNATKDNTMVGSFSYRNSVNILQWVYYTEAANQSLEGRKAIFSIVWNRAGGIPEKLVPVVLKSGLNSEGVRVYQFSEWKPGNNWGLVAPKTNADWKYKVPKDITNPKVQKIWKEGEEFAKQMLAGNWKSNIGRCNLIASDNDSENAKNTWGKDCTARIGDHRFGYDPYQDGFRTKKANIAKAGQLKNNYTVKKGDSLWKIAKVYKTTPKDIATKNNIDVNSILKIGLKLKV